MILALLCVNFKRLAGSDHTFAIIEMFALAVAIFLLAFTFTTRLDLRTYGIGIVKDIN